MFLLTLMDASEKLRPALAGSPHVSGGNYWLDGTCSGDLRSLRGGFRLCLE